MEINMDSVKDLSKEEYNTYLEKFLDNEILKKFNFDKEICIFHNTRGNVSKCEKNIETNHGFCSTHKNTLQSKNSKKIFEDFLKDLEILRKKIISDDLKNEIDNIGNEESEEEEPREEPQRDEEEEETRDDSPRRKNHSSNKDSSEEESSSSEEEEESSSEEETSSSEEEADKITVYRNKWGNYEDSNTGIVFDKRTGNAIGYQKNNGEIFSLAPKHVEICIKNGWSYNLPKSVYKSK